MSRHSQARSLAQSYPTAVYGVTWPGRPGLAGLAYKYAIAPDVSASRKAGHSCRGRSYAMVPPNILKVQARDVGFSSASRTA